MLGSPCSPCCVNCAGVFAFFAARTPVVTVSGSAPGQQGATLISQWLNYHLIGASSSTSIQQMPNLVRIVYQGVWPVPAGVNVQIPADALVLVQTYTDTGWSGTVTGQIATVYAANSAEKQKAWLSARNVHAASYRRAGLTADGTHELSVDLSKSFQRADGTGVLTFIKDTTDYTITCTIGIGNTASGGALLGGGTSVPGVSCPIDFSVGLVQHTYYAQGVLSPGYETCEGSLQYTFYFNNETRVLNVTPVVRWPTAAGGEESLGTWEYPSAWDNRYDPREMQRWVQGDMSSENIVASQKNLGDIFSPVFEYSPGEKTPVTWVKYNAASWVQGRPVNVVADTGTRVTYRLAGSIPSRVQFGMGVWETVAAGAGHREDLQCGMFEYVPDFNTPIPRINSIPPRGTLRYRQKYFGALRVLLDVEHP